MGNRLHYSPVYQVTYDGGYFNNQSAEINRLLQENSEDIQFTGENIECAEHLEVPRADLANLVARIVTYREEFSEWLDSHSVDCTPEKFISIICGWIANSDPRNDYVVLTWF